MKGDLILISECDLRKLISEEVSAVLEKFKINSPPIEDELLTPLEVCNLLKLSLSGLAKHRKLKPKIRQHKFVRYSANEVKAYIAQQNK